jgi:hypothetical protein
MSRYDSLKGVEENFRGNFDRESDVVLEGGSRLLYTKDDAIKSSFDCPECDFGTMSFDEEASVRETLIDFAIKLNRIEELPRDVSYIFKCSNCSFYLDTDRASVLLNRFIKKAEDLREVARLCNPKQGQTWAAKEKLPVEICPINENPCFSELWKVCPHIGNDIESDLVNNPHIPFIGDL